MNRSGYITVSPSTGTPMQVVLNAVYNYMPDQYPTTTWSAARNGVGNDYSSTTDYIYS